MDFPQISSADFLPLLPALILSVGGIFLLLSEVFLATASRHYQSVVSAVVAGIAMVAAISTVAAEPRTVFEGFAAQDPFSSLVNATICLGLLLTLMLSSGFLHSRKAERGEFYALMLFAAAGMTLLAVSNELITLFINLEVMSIATYALTAYLRRGPRPAEAGFKYFILGAFSSALLLYGTALLYGATGSTHLAGIGAELASAFRTSPALVYVGMFLVGAGFAFKVAAVPFHMWTPDVYEGAPTPVTALMSAGVKAAAFAALVRVFMAFAPGVGTDPVVGPIALLALLTMVLGNLMAIPQRNVKRMLAYSSIAHAGYVLAAVAALFVTKPGGKGFNAIGAMEMAGQQLGTGRADALKAIVFYLLAYTVTAVGAFGIVSALERREDDERGTSWDLERFAGLAQRRPGWAVAMAAFMLSLGGIPPTVGFMGKLYVFRATVDAGLVGLSIIGVLASAAGVYYYLRVVVYMFMRPAVEGALLSEERSWGTEAALVLTTAAVILFGILPGPIPEWLARGGILALQ